MGQMASYRRAASVGACVPPGGPRHQEDARFAAGLRPTPRLDPVPTVREHDRCRHPLLLRPGVSLLLAHEQMDPDGAGRARSDRGLAVHLPASDQRAHRLRRALPTGVRGRSHRRSPPAPRRREGAEEHGSRAVDALQAALGARIFDTPPGDSADDTTTRELRGTRDFVAPILREADLPLDLVDALDDASWDEAIRADGEEALGADRHGRGHADHPLRAAGGGGVLRPRDPAGCPSRTARSSCGTTRSASPASPVSPSSSAACASNLSWWGSAWSPARRHPGGLARRQSTTAERAWVTEPPGTHRPSRREGDRPAVIRSWRRAPSRARGARPQR